MKFVSRKVGVESSVNKLGRNMPNPYPNFISLFQFAKKVTWCITRGLMGVGECIHVVNIVDDSSHVYCTPSTRKEWPREGIYSVLGCSKYSCFRIVSIAFVQLDIIKLNCWFNGEIVKMGFQICMECNNVVCSTVYKQNQKYKLR